MFDEIFLEKASDNIKKVLHSLDLYAEINESEYIYIDELDLKYIKNPLLQNKIVVTRKIKDFFMFENNTITNTPQLTKLDYKHIVDILILNNQENSSINDIKELIDQDTILIKNLGHNIIYIEDNRKQIKIIITEQEKIVLTQNGINTQLKYYEKIN